MKFKIGFLAAASLAAGLVNAGVLYWQVNPSSYTLGEGDGNYAYARLVNGDSATSVGTAVDSYVLGASADMASPFVDMTSVDGAPLLADISGFNDSSKSFWIELYSSTGAWVAKSDNFTYSELGSYVHEPLSFTPADMTSPSVWTTTSYTPLPEPTSGLLLLIGAGLLGLRRKRQA